MALLLAHRLVNKGFYLFDYQFRIIESIYRLPANIIVSINSCQVCD